MAIFHCGISYDGYGGGKEVKDYLWYRGCRRSLIVNKSQMKKNTE